AFCFSQAEDGIRDDLVTGVQTCALPIYGLGLLSLGATTAGGFDVLGSQWAVAEEMAAEHGKTVERARWRLVGPMHIAPTMDQARADVAFGLPAWVDYFQRVAALPLVGDATELGDMIDAMNQTGLAVI